MTGPVLCRDMYLCISLSSSSVHWNHASFAGSRLAQYSRLSRTHLPSYAYSPLLTPLFLAILLSRSLHRHFRSIPGRVRLHTETRRRICPLSAPTTLLFQTLVHLLSFATVSPFFPCHSFARLSFCPSLFLWMWHICGRG